MYIAPKNASTSGFNADTYLKLREQRLANQNAASQTRSAPSSTDFVNNTQNTQKTVSSDLIATSFADERNVSRLNAEKQAQEARQEYEAAKSKEQYSGHAAVVNMAAAAQPGSTYNLPQMEQESDELRALRERAEAAEKEAQRAQQDYRLSQDQKTYEQDMQKIRSLSADTQAALDTYARLNSLARNSTMQNQYLSAQRVLRQAGLSDEQMNALAETWARMENAETMAQKQQEYAQAAEENPLLHNVLSVPASIAGAISGTGAVISEAVDRMDGSRYSTLDPNLPGYSPSVYTGTVREVTTENIDDGSVLGKAGATLYGATMSAADNLARIVTLGPTGSLALAGMSSFQDSVRDVTSRGGTPAQAYAMGVATAGLEVLTEKVSLDSLISTKSPESITQLLKNAAIQGGIEVSEEELNFAGGLIADAVIMGGNSEFDRTVADLIAGGMSAEEAKRQALMNNLNQAANVAAQSFLSGGLMSGGQAGIQLMANGGFGAPQAAPAPTAEQNPAPTQNAAQPSQTAPAQQEYGEAFTQNYLKLREERLAKQNQPPSRYVAPDGLRYEDMTPAQKMAADMMMAAERLKNGTAYSTPVENAEKQPAAPVPVDAATPAGYNNTINQGGNTYAEQHHDRTAGFGDPAQGLAGVQQGHGSGVEGRREHGGLVGDLGVLRVSDALASAQQKRGIPTYPVRDTTSTPTAYEQALLAGRNSDTINGWCVTPKSAAELAEGNVRTFMNDSGTVGVGVAPDGDIVAVFKNRNGGPRKALDTIMPIAIEQGGDRLDCYGDGLVRVYESYGFIPVARVEFNPEYANDGWTPDKGTPFIYFMVHNGDSAETVVERMGSYKFSTREEREALPTYGKDDYDAAMQYRNSLLEGKKTSPGTGSVSPDESVGAAPQGFDPYTNLQYEYGNQPDRANDFRPVNVPKRDTYNRKVTEVAANAYGAEAVPDSFIPVIEQLVMDGTLGHDSRTNQESLTAAAKEIARQGKSNAKTSIGNAIKSGKIGENDIAKAMLLFTHYANKGGSDAQDAATELFVDLSQMATRAGRDLQLFKLLRKLTPQGQLQAIVRKANRSVDQINQTRAQKEQVTVEIPQELQDEFVNAAQEAAEAQQSGDEAAEQEAQRKVDEAEQAIYAAAAAQIPGTLQEKWDAWRYMAMLGNPKTQIRNIIGNAAFRPFVSAKRFLNSAAQAMLKPQNRTTALLGFSEADNALRDFAARDAKAQESRMEYTGTTGDSATTEIQEQRKIFKNEALEYLRTKLSDLMGAEDMLFKRMEYRAALASYLKAKGVTAAQLDAGEHQDILEAARTHAVQEAMKATFNDRNALSNFVVNFRYKGNNPIGKAANALGEGILPFRRTPANIIVRGLEYSPANFLRGVTNALTKVRSGEMSAADAIDQMSSGLVGTGALALGYALASGMFGVRLVGAEDNEDERRAGHQSYALEIGDISYTVDWAAPVNLPLFMGANLYAALNAEDRSPDVSAVTAFLDVTANTLEPMLELSCLSSLNDLIQDIRYADEGREIYSILASNATNYFLQGIPTLLGQIEQATEAEKKSVYAESTDPFTEGVQRALGRATQKIPGIDLFQATRLDEWGRTQQKDPALRAAEAFFSPGYTSTINPDAVETEIRRLNLTQDLNASPRTASKTVSIGGKEVRLTAEQWEQLQTAQGKTAHRIVSDLISSRDYNLLTDSEKASVIRSAYDYAREYARVTNVDGYDAFSAKWMEGIGGKEASTILGRMMQDLSGLTESKYNAASEAGISLESMQYVSDTFGKLKPETGYSTVRDIQQYEAIVRSPNFNDDQEEAWLKVLFDDKMDQKLDTAQEMGYTSEMFVKAYRTYLDNNYRKADTVQDFQEKFGVSEEEAEALYKLYKGTK